VAAVRVPGYSSRGMRLRDALSRGASSELPQIEGLFSPTPYALSELHRALEGTLVASISGSSPGGGTSESCDITKRI
jgi:hypothetical protein